MASSKPNLKIGKRQVKGEPWVWLSGGAVATGIVMIIGVLALITVEGSAAFWPHDVKAYVLGAPRFYVHDPEQGQAWLTRDDEAVVFRSNGDAYRSLTGAEFEGDAATLQPLTMQLYAEQRDVLTDDVDWLIRQPDKDVAIYQGSAVSPANYIDNAVRYLIDMGHDERLHYFSIDNPELKPKQKLTAEELTNLFGKLLIEHPKHGQVYVAADGNRVFVQVAWKTGDGRPVELEMPAPRRATIADFREYRAVFAGSDWLLADPQGGVVQTEDGTAVTAQTYIDNPEQFPSPWGYIDEDGKRAPIEQLLGDDKWRDYQLLVGTPRGERAMDIRQLPPRETGEPWRSYQLDEDPQEILVRQGNQGDGLYGPDRYFRWVRSDLPDLAAARRVKPSVYHETILETVALPGAATIERLEKGVLTGYVTRVTVEGDVLADIEKDGREKVWEVFNSQQSRMREEYLKRHEIEKDDLGEVNAELKEFVDEIKGIRYDHRDSREVVVALEKLEKKFKEWQALEPLDNEYETTELYDGAREEWLNKLEPLLKNWQAETVEPLTLSEDNTEALQQAREIQQKRGTVQAKDFARLRFETNKMRAAEAQALYTFETPDGRESELVLAEVVRAFRPNELGAGGKFATYADRVWEFLSDEPREANTEGGVWPAILGTLVMVMLMCVAVVPFGVIAALYLREYAKQGAVVSAVRIAVNNLAGVPSIVFGIFGLGFFCILVGGTIDQVFYPELLPAPTFGGGGIMWAALTLALLTVPVVIVSTEEALSAVPSSQREASLACGASKFQTVSKVVLPQALPGVLTGTILAMARGAGEVAPLMLVGAVKFFPDPVVDAIPPFLHLERKFMFLGFHIYDVGFQSPNVDNTKPLVFATALILILLVAALNVFAITLRNRLRKKFATSAV